MDLIDEIRALEEWGWICARDKPGLVLGETSQGPCVLVEASARCEHDPCYETHETQIIVRVGDVHYRRKAEYSSQDGLVLFKEITKVSPKFETVRVWN
jgi:hypothetical protein